MIHINEFTGTSAEIGEDYALLDGVELRGIADWAALSLSDDSGGAELLEARLIGLRRRRNGLLTDCDWTQLPDAPLDDGTRARWQAYRQALRDLPEGVTNGNLFAVVWPNMPE
jgi:hypothetical protein